MTCVVGIQAANGAYLAADSASASEYYSTVSETPKLFALAKHPDILLGGTTSYRMLQLLRYELSISGIDFAMQGENWMVRIFVHRVRELFKLHGFLGKDNSDNRAAEREVGGDFLVAYKGIIYHVQSDFSVQRNASGLYAVGSAYQYALGAMDAVQKYAESDPIAILTWGLKEANEYQPGYVRQPFIYLEQRREEDVRPSGINPNVNSYIPDSGLVARDNPGA